MRNVRLSDVDALSQPEIGAIALSLARDVADLHRRDVVHGHIRPSRVTLSGTAVALDPPDGAGFSKPHDVRSIGELTLWLISRCGHRDDSPLADAARGAAALDPAARPTAEQLVDRLEAVERQASAINDDEAAAARSRAPLLLAAAVAVIVLGGTTAAVMFARAESEHRAPGPRSAEPTQSTSTVAAALPAQVWPDAIRACADVTAVMTGDLDGDGCEEAVEAVGGRLQSATAEVEISGVQLTHHVTGDWHCRRQSTLAALDVTTGRVFVFPRWAAPGDHVEAVTVAHVDGASALLADDLDGDGCTNLRARTADGREVSIDVPVDLPGW